MENHASIFGVYCSAELKQAPDFRASKLNRKSSFRAGVSALSSGTSEINCSIIGFCWWFQDYCCWKSNLIAPASVLSARCGISIPTLAQPGALRAGVNTCPNRP